jgi:hypothetical protein
MIHVALAHITERLNEFLARGLGLTEDLAVLSQLSDRDGSPTPGAGNKLVLFLVNLEKEHAARSSQAVKGGAGDSVRRFPSLHLKLYVMLTANFDGGSYPEALKMLSAAILFFQRNPVFDHHSSPSLDQRIEKLILDIENLPWQEMANLWGTQGGKYLPSVLYKVRMVAFDSEDIRALEPAARELATNIRN